MEVSEGARGGPCLRARPRWDGGRTDVLQQQRVPAFAAYRAAVRGRPRSDQLTQLLEDALLAIEYPVHRAALGQWVDALEEGTPSVGEEQPERGGRAVATEGALGTSDRRAQQA